MKVQIKRIESSLPLPEFETEGAAGFDLIARKDVVVHEHTPALITCQYNRQSP